MAPLVPILRSKILRAWPGHEEGGAVDYLPLDEALTRTYSTDAHTAAYSVPSIRRRLDSAAAGRVVVVMAVVIFDVDGEAHQASDAWWACQLDLLSDLEHDHPGGFVYRTRGGYRIVYLLAEQVEITDRLGAAGWRRLYEAWCNYLSRRYRIIADRACQDWTRLYRLPHATREEGGQPESLAVIGDASEIGHWHPSLGEEDWPTIEATKVSSGPLQESTWSAGQPWDLLTLFTARGAVLGEIGAGKIAVVCPWADEHTVDSGPSQTVIFPPTGDSTLGGFHCKHAHCLGRTGVDVLALAGDAERLTISTARDAALMSDMDLTGYSEHERAVAAGVANGALTMTNGVHRHEAVGPNESGAAAPQPPPRLPPTAAQVVRDAAGRPPERVYPTGIQQLDKLIGGGWRSRQLALLIGPPGAGKTAFACWSATLIQEHLPVLYASTELESLEVAQRAYSVRSGVPLDHVTRGEVTSEEVAAALEAQNIRVLGCDELEGPDPLKVIAEHARAMRDHLGVPPVVIVDYVQQLARTLPDRTRLVLTEVARQLRKLAQELDAPVLAVSSTSRAAYGRTAKAQAQRDIDATGEDDPRDMLAAGKESGDLEYSAAVVIYLDVATAADEAGDYPARLRVAKARRGHAGDAGVVFSGPTGRWWPSPDAVDKLGPAGRAAAKAEREGQRREELEAAILQELRKGPATADALVPRMGRRKLDTRAAIAALAGRGDIIEMSVTVRCGSGTREVDGWGIAP